MPKKFINNSFKSNNTSPTHTLVKKRYKLPGLTLVMFLLAVGFTLSDADVMAYAAQQDYNIVNYAVETTSLNQSDRWYTGPNGTWYLRNEAGTGNVVNSWFEDLDGAWYLLAPEDGHMYAGLIHDTLTDRWYYCQVEHDGYYGRMAHTDGVYTINNQQVHLTFNQSHDGTFGALTSNIDAIKSTGVPVVEVDSLPVDSAKASPSSSSQSDTVVTDVDTEVTIDTPTGGDNQSTGAGTLSDYDKQFDRNHDGILDDNERMGKKLLEEIAAGEHNDGIDIGGGTGYDWK